MTKDELRRIGEAIFGPCWQTPLAKALTRPEGGHVNPRTVRRWAAGKYQPKPELQERIRQLLTDHEKAQP